MTEKKRTEEQVEEPIVADEVPETGETTETGADSEETTSKGASGRKKKAKEDDALQQAESELAELRDKYLRMYAEFDNYKKRTVKEKLDLMRTAAQDTLTSLLPLLDDFDRAKKIADDPATTEQFTDGVSLVYQKLYTTLSALGLRPMESTGMEFDPEQHEAVTEIPAPSPEMKGKVVDTIEKGYFLNDKIIRHAKVVIGK